VAEITQLQTVLYTLQAAALLGAFVVGIVSWLRNGIVKKMMKAVEEVNKITDWREDVNLVLIAIAESENGVDEEEVRSKLDEEKEYKELLNNGQQKKNRR
jgi:hypothetical protein